MLVGESIVVDLGQINTLLWPLMPMTCFYALISHYNRSHYTHIYEEEKDQIHTRLGGK
jgi:hypothetical protein